MSRRTTLDEPADIHAKPGSSEWSRGVARKIRCTFEQVDSDVANLQRWIDTASKFEAWRALGYLSLDAFLVSEAGFTQSIIEAIRNAKNGTVGEAIQAARENPIAEKPGNPSGNNQYTPKEERKGDNVTFPHRGNSQSYTLRRLARDGREDLLDKVAAGEISANAAAIEAGFRKKQTPDEQCLRAFRKAENHLETLIRLFDWLEHIDGGREIIASLSEDVLNRIARTREIS